MGKNKHFAVNSKSVELEKYVRLSTMNTFIYGSTSGKSTHSVYSSSPERSFFKPKKEIGQRFDWNDHIHILERRNRKSIGNIQQLVDQSNLVSRPPLPPQSSFVNTRPAYEMSDLKRLQRNQIYALNELMTKLEHDKFLEFCQKHNISSDSH